VLATENNEQLKRKNLMKRLFQFIGFICSLYLIAFTPFVVADIYYTQTSEIGSGGDPLPPTKLLSVKENGVDPFVDLGNIKLNGQHVAITAIAMDSSGELYGFSWTKSTNKSQLLKIDLDDLSSTPTCPFCSPFTGQIKGAGFDASDTLWVVKKNPGTTWNQGGLTINRFNISAQSPEGARIQIPAPIGGDIAFDIDNNCYFIGALPISPSGQSTPLYSCNLGDNTLTSIGPLVQSGFTNGKVTVSGIAFSVIDDPFSGECSNVLMVSDGAGVDEVGIVNLNADPLTATQVSSTGVNNAVYHNPDLAGFPSVVDNPICAAACGNGELNDVELCDDGNTDDGEGCSASCVVETGWSCTTPPFGSSVCAEDPVDTDNDGIIDDADNCPAVANPGQEDTWGDERGDACDDPPADTDGDTIIDDEDNCPLEHNTDQADNDGDTQGDACDADDDNDGELDGADNCPLSANSDQADNDGDGQGDVCDADDDNDGILDGPDNCPLDANANQANNDGDALGDVCDADDDNDGVLDDTDNCPIDANADQADLDGDGVGDTCDSDIDGDGVANSGDTCATTAADATVDESGCSIADHCECGSDWKSHGQYVSCVTRTANGFAKAGLISRKDKGSITKQAAKSSCGK
jgi:cysteine-rich repeat protein